MFRLTYDKAAGATHDALPAEASEQLTLALADVCHDPIGNSAPYGEPDDYMRMVITDTAFAVILVGHTAKTVTVLQINYLG